MNSEISNTSGENISDLDEDYFLEGEDFTVMSDDQQKIEDKISSDVKEKTHNVAYGKISSLAESANESITSPSTVLKEKELESCDLDTMLDVGYESLVDKMSEKDEEEQDEQEAVEKTEQEEETNSDEDDSTTEDGENAEFDMDVSQEEEEESSMFGQKRKRTQHSEDETIPETDSEEEDKEETTHRRKSKPRRRRQNTSAISEMRAQQKLPNSYVSVKPFQHLVEEVLSEILHQRGRFSANSNKRLTKSSRELLMEAGVQYMEDLFSWTQYSTDLNKRRQPNQADWIIASTLIKSSDPPPCRRSFIQRYSKYPMAARLSLAQQSRAFSDNMVVCDLISPLQAEKVRRDEEKLRRQSISQRR